MIVSRLGFGIDPKIDHVRFDDGHRDLELATTQYQSLHKKLEIVASLPYPPGNIAISKNTKRIFFTFHPEYEPPINVAEIKGDGYDEYPTASPSTERITSCLSLRVDNSNDILYILDFGHHGLKMAPALFGFQLATDRSDDKLVLHYPFPSHVAGKGSMLNDFQITSDGSVLIIADTSILGLTPALIVFDVTTKTSYRILSEYRQLFGKSLLMTVPISREDLSREDIQKQTEAKSYPGSMRMPNLGPLGLKIHVDSIALSDDNKTLFVGALTNHVLYSIDMNTILLHTVHGKSTSGITAPSGEGYVLGEVENALINQTMKPVSLVNNLGEPIVKPVTDGIYYSRGRMYMTACEYSALSIYKQVVEFIPTEHNDFQFKLEESVQDTQYMRWPDGLAIDEDMQSNGRHIYITNSALHYKFQHHGMPTKQIAKLHGPFHISKMKMPE